MMEEEKMKNEQFLEQYLSGKAPLHADRLKLPAEEELDVAEAEFDRKVAARKRPARLISFWPWVGTAVAAGVLLLIVLNIGQHQPKQQPIVAETVEQNASQPIVEEKEVEPQEPSETPKANEPNKPHKLNEVHKPQPQQLAAVTTTYAADSTPRLTNAADSLYYYLTQLENQMGECRDSTCLAELGNLMRADERIKGLVNKIIHKQVETAYQEEYLVDTTTRYIPL